MTGCLGGKGGDRAQRADAASQVDSLAAGTMDLSAYEPLHPQYKLLRDAFQHLRSLSEVPWPTRALHEGTRSITVGDGGQELVHIRERLRTLLLNMERMR